MASKRRNMFYENKKQETTEIDSSDDKDIAVEEKLRPDGTVTGDSITHDGMATGNSYREYDVASCGEEAALDHRKWADVTSPSPGQGTDPNWWGSSLISGGDETDWKGTEVSRQGEMENENEQYQKAKFDSRSMEGRILKADEDRERGSERERNDQMVLRVAGYLMSSSRREASREEYLEAWGEGHPIGDPVGTSSPRSQGPDGSPTRNEVTSPPQHDGQSADTACPVGNLASTSSAKDSMRKAAGRRNEIEASTATRRKRIPVSMKWYKRKMATAVGVTFSRIRELSKERDRVRLVAGVVDARLRGEAEEEARLEAELAALKEESFRLGAGHEQRVSVLLARRHHLLQQLKRYEVTLSRLHQERHSLDTVPPIPLQWHSRPAYTTRCFGLPR
ncbi:hypothetical protein AAG570_010515 [Ranatra chinensis]|uniref:Uncharacterized protein n=1 Tax=Ranatra chinensis TaxID=642074 RepID=A0ABD0Z8V4_9HEMI